MLNNNQIIYKYELPQHSSHFSFAIPKDAEILKYDTDHQGKVCIWVLAYEFNSPEVRQFRIFGTGVSIYNGAGTKRKFIGTCKYPDGEFIGHLFEIVG
jgi:hypothetical protein